MVTVKNLRLSLSTDTSPKSSMFGPILSFASSFGMRTLEHSFISLAVLGIRLKLETTPSLSSSSSSARHCALCCGLSLPSGTSGFNHSGSTGSGSGGPLSTSPLLSTSPSDVGSVGLTLAAFVLRRLLVRM